MDQNETPNANSIFLTIYYMVNFALRTGRTVFENLPFCLLISYVITPIVVFVNGLKN